MKNSTAVDKTNNSWQTQMIVNKMNSLIWAGGTRLDCIKALKKAGFESVILHQLMDKVEADIK